MSKPATAVYDPYAQDERPSIFQKHEAWVWSICVFAATVLLTVLSFPPFKAAEFAYAFAMPAVFWAYRKPSFKRFAWTVLAAQAVAWTILLSWLHNVTWAGLFLLGPFIGVWVGLWFLGAWWLIPRLPGRMAGLRILAMLGLGGLWVVLEWSRTWVLGGFPWLPLSVSQWQKTTALQIAAFTGGYGISFVLIVMNIGFAAYAHRLFFEKAKGLQKRSQEFFAAMFLLLVCISIHVQETFNRGQFTAPLGRVGFVQPAIPQTVKWDGSQAASILEVLTKTTKRAAAGRPEFILWPEAVTPYAIKGDTNSRLWVEQLVADVQLPLLLGSVGIEQAGQPDAYWVNGAYVVDPSIGLQSGDYAKRRLVPFGEFVPMRSLLGWLSKFVPIGEGDFIAGDSAAPLRITTREGRQLAAGALICYEDIFPKLAVANVKDGADFHVVFTNNGWFGEGGAAYQHAAHAVLRAVETRRPVLRCGNAGWSGWIDEFGSIRAVLTRDEAGKIHTDPKAEDTTIYFRGATSIDVTRDARWAGKESFYVAYGDWFVWVSFALIAIGYAAVAFTQVTPPKPEESDESSA